MKKVLYITNLPAPYKITYFELLSKSVNLTVIYERIKASNRDEKWKNESEKHFQEIVLNGKKVGNEASFAPNIVRYLKEKYDVILLNGYSSPTAMIAIAYMKLNKIKFGIVCDGILPGKESDFKKKVKTFLISSASFWMSSGDVTTERLLKYGAKNERIFKYPFSSIRDSEIVTPGQITPEKKREYKNKIRCKEQKMILYVGQLIPRKGIDVLLDAYQNIDEDTRLYIVGGTKEQAKQYKNYDNKNITYVNFQNKIQLTNYYMAADVFVLPTREDIWGLVVNEALAYGLPVITTDHCGAGLELIHDNINGYLIKTNSVEELMEKTKVILQTKMDKNLSTTLSVIKRYTLEAMAEETRKIIEMVGIENVQ